MSTSLNTLSSTIYEDFIKPIYGAPLSDHTANIIMKLTVVVLGVICSLLVFIVEKLGAILQLSATFHGVTSGSFLALFSFGMFYPWGNTKGMLAGALTGFVATAWIAVGAELAILNGKLSFPGKITSIDGCPPNMTLPEGLNTTQFGYPGVGTMVLADDDVSWVFKLSYMYISSVGLTISIVVAILVSYLTGGEDLTELDPNLIIPQLRRFLPQTKEKKPVNELYTMVSTTENISQS